MSTVEGYELHVYCDECGESDQFAASTRASCYAQARLAGWTISTRRAPSSSVAGGRRASCPTHSGKKAQPQPLLPGQRFVTLSELRSRPISESTHD